MRCFSAVTLISAHPHRSFCLPAVPAREARDYNNLRNKAHLCCRALSPVVADSVEEVGE
jgi:hypothetical protein